jgi:hypothetical protein
MSQINNMTLISHNYNNPECSSNTDSAYMQVNTTITNVDLVLIS